MQHRFDHNYLQDTETSPTDGVCLNNVKLMFCPKCATCCHMSTVWFHSLLFTSVAAHVSWGKSLSLFPSPI